MQKIIIIDNRKAVKFNHYAPKKPYYFLRFDWPENTIFNINGPSTDEAKEMLEKQGYKIEYYMEVFLNTENVDTFDGVHGTSFEECETKLWDKYQKYIKCNHEFIRESPCGTHYSNGAGFCKHCGMFKSKAFEPETKCMKCGKNANLNKCVNGESVCIDCYRELPWSMKLGCEYFSDISFHNYCSSHQDIFERFEMEENKGILKLKNTILMKNKDFKEKCIVEWTMKKEENGVYRVIDFNGKGFYLMSKFLFGNDNCYYFYGIDGIHKLIKKKNTIHRNLRNGLLTTNYAKHEIRKIESLLSLHMGVEMIENLSDLESKFGHLED